ncbi:holin family protein [Brevibacillus brevis]|uniref:Holin n=1 Tax=Brevibacillus brevis TaxID=1393 RepID=A0A517IAA2_BREBE|nr:phage holin family protein [Brevibacillus brevis]QDS35818.1 holin [Brevibacillus brevis]
MKFLQSLENVVTPANGIAATLGVFLTPIFQYLYGTGRMDILFVLFFMIAIDWITGISAAKKDKSYTSEYGLSRIPRSLFLLALPAVANMLDRVMGTPGFLFYGVTFGLLYHTWNSLTANAHRAGWPIPKSIVNLVGSEIKAKAERAARKEQK